MAKAYWIAFYREIKDPNKLSAYAQLAKPAIEAGGGRFLARGIPEHVYDGGLKERAVLIAFDSMSAAIATHESAAYQKALAALGDGVDRDLRMIAGI
jgi:uncharacterized protein (DUF1330 family)